jgi:hypothetical protein
MLGSVGEEIDNQDVRTTLLAASAARTSESNSTSISIIEEICQMDGITTHQFMLWKNKLYSNFLWEGEGGIMVSVM